MTATPIGTAPTAVPPVEQAGGRGRVLRRVLLGLGLLLLLFAGTYAFAWSRAQSLARTYTADADASYAEGEYLNALTGYEEFDEEANAYITRGGYAKVARIWADPNAWPRPAGVEHAQQRIDEILQQHITIEEAEGFIQANTGRNNPYLGIVFLRLGELYAEEGDERSAEDIYEEIPELFPNEPDLIARAQENLAGLEE